MSWIAIFAVAICFIVYGVRTVAHPVYVSDPDDAVGFGAFMIAVGLGLLFLTAIFSIPWAATHLP